MQKLEFYYVKPFPLLSLSLSVYLLCSFKLFVRRAAQNAHQLPLDHQTETALSPGDLEVDRPAV